jgi:hypothetical protein
MNRYQIRYSDADYSRECNVEAESMIAAITAFTNWAERNGIDVEIECVTKSVCW